MAVNYWIAQYMGDLFRREPRNVGVFVEEDGVAAARFLGIGDNGQIDGRKLKGRVEYIDVYKQWVEFWTKEIQHTSVPEVLEMSGPHYQVVEGGVVDDASGELAGVAEYLYSLLVSERATRDTYIADEEGPAVALINELIDAFKADNILAAGGAVPVVPHPVRRSVVVSGPRNVEYKPAFTQENGRLYLMETIDFTTTKKKTARDFAGWTAYQFRDVKAFTQRDTEPIAIVKVMEQDIAEEEDVRNGMAVLRNEARVVNWLDVTQKQTFLEERGVVARSHHGPESGSQ
jgi:hypothetical protein